jgi:hypothetical protein
LWFKFQQVQFLTFKTFIEPDEKRFSIGRMSQQKSLNAFFNVRKRPADQHAAKRRKVILDNPSAAVVPSTKKDGATKIREMANIVVKEKAESVGKPEVI